MIAHLIVEFFVLPSSLSELRRTSPILGHTPEPPRPVPPTLQASIQDIKGYQQHVADECAIFPEANLFPYILPALAYGNLALKHPAYTPIANHADKQGSNIEFKYS